MNDTTKWIMIILLLLLIAAAVFMLLRSPGKDNGDRDAVTGRDAAGRVDADRDGVADSHEGGASAAGLDTGRGADRGVYDQEADLRGSTVRDEAPVAGQDHPVADREHHPVADRDHPVADRDEPVAPAAYGDTTAAPVEDAAYDDTTTTAVEVPPAHDDDRTGYRDGGHQEAEVQPLTDDQVSAGGRDEPLTRHEQAPGTSPDGVAVDHAHDHDRHDHDHARPDDLGAGRPTGAGIDRDGPDLTAAAAAGAAGAAGAGTAADERPMGEDSTTYRAADGDAVVVEDTRGGWDAAPADTTWDAPADTGYGTPQTADDIVEGRSEGATTTQDADVTPGGASGYAPVFTEAAYGPGSAEPLEDGTGPAGWEIKGNIGSMLFHTPESPSYDAVRAEVWFESEDAARAAGFAHWDRRRR